MRLEIEAFGYDQPIPAKFSRDGGNRSPALAFRDVPREAKSLVLILDDPDAPRGLFTHWVVYNIQPDVGGFPENDVPRGVTQGKNSWGEARYGGPKPPDREHRYFFHVSALDVVLPFGAGAERANVEREMAGHVIAEAEYMGRYAPQGAESASPH